MHRVMGVGRILQLEPIPASEGWKVFDIL